MGLSRTSSRETSRNEHFCERLQTRVCQEIPDVRNAFQAKQVLWHGYDAVELARHRDLIDVIFLLLRGDLPTPPVKRLLERLLIVLANPGPRHAATRSVMTAAVAKTRADQLLPIGMSLMTGDWSGSGEVDSSMRFLVRSLAEEPELVASRQLQALAQSQNDDGRLVAGFGQHVGAPDPFAASIAEMLLLEHPDSEVLRWGQAFVEHISVDNYGWLLPGVAAAVFVELGFKPMIGAGLYQLAACPGLLAHGAEMVNKPITSLPFVADDNYHYHEDCDAESV